MDFDPSGAPDPGQVPSYPIGSDAFQETPDRWHHPPLQSKHNYLVRSIEDLPCILHEAFHVARLGVRAPWWWTCRKTLTLRLVITVSRKTSRIKRINPRSRAISGKIKQAVEMMAQVKRPVFYTGGGVINSGKVASDALCELAELTGFPATSTLMGLGAYPVLGKQWLGMLDGTAIYEANLTTDPAI